MDEALTPQSFGLSGDQVLGMDTRRPLVDDAESARVVGPGGEAEIFVGAPDVLSAEGPGGASTEADTQSAFERTDSRLWRGAKVLGRAAVKGMAFVGALASEASSFLTSSIGSAEGIRLKTQLNEEAAQLVRDKAVGRVQAWHDQPWSRAKAVAPVVSTLAWANLVLGESIALWSQGKVELLHPSPIINFLANVAITAAIELGFTYPIARKNDRRRETRELEKQTSAEDIIAATATAFWLGGAMGVEQKNLGRKHMLIAIGGYMLFDLGLAALGTHHDWAIGISEFLQQPPTLCALAAAGLVKKVNELAGYEGILDKAAAKTVKLAGWVTGRELEPTEKAAEDSADTADE